MGINSGLRISRMQFDGDFRETLISRFAKDRKNRLCPPPSSCENLGKNATHILLNTIWNAGLYDLPPHSVEKIGNGEHSSGFVIRLPLKHELRVDFNETAISMFTVPNGVIILNNAKSSPSAHIDDFVALSNPSWRSIFQKKLRQHILALRDGPG